MLILVFHAHPGFSMLSISSPALPIFHALPVFPFPLVFRALPGFPSLSLLPVLLLGAKPCGIRSRNSQTRSAGIYSILSLRLDSHTGIPTLDSWHFQTVIPNPKALFLVGILGIRARPTPFSHFSPIPDPGIPPSTLPAIPSFPGEGLGAAIPEKDLEAVPALIPQFP